MAENRLTPEELDEALVAYLDGELEPPEARRIEDRLAHDGRARQRLAQLASSWDLLSQLPRASADESFARTTVEMVALAAESEIAQLQEAAPSRNRLRWIAGGLAAIVAAVLGFGAVAVPISDRNRDLLRDLPAIANFDVYQQTGSIELARLLNDRKLFAGEGSDGAPRQREEDAAQRVPDSLEQRAAWLEQLGPERKNELRRNFERFNALSDEQQQALRTLDEQLKIDPKGAELQRAMARYQQWLSTRSPTDRLELAEISDPRQKAAAIVREKREHEGRMFARSGSTGERGPENETDKWLREFAQQNRAKLLESAPADRREQFEHWDDRRQGFFLMRQAWQHWWSPGAETLPPLSDNDWRSLREHLPPDVQRQLREADGRPAQIDVLRQWFAADFRQRWGSGRGAGGPGADRLRRFLDELPPDQRQRLLDLEPEERQRELLKLFQQRRPPDGPRRGMHDQPPGDKRGPDAMPPGDDSRPPRSPPPDGRFPPPRQRRGPPEQQPLQ